MESEYKRKDREGGKMGRTTSGRRKGRRREVHRRGTGNGRTNLQLRLVI